MAYYSTYRWVQTSANNTAQTYSVGGDPAGGTDKKKWRVKWVSCSYGNTATQTGVTLTINSGAGAGYDVLVATGSANARYSYFSAATFGDLILEADDTLDITAPAGGASVPSAIAVETEQYFGSAQ